VRSAATCKVMLVRFPTILAAEATFRSSGSSRTVGIHIERRYGVWCEATILAE